MRDPKELDAVEKKRLAKVHEDPSRCVWIP